ncbi:MAG: hypothetical protein COA91_06630 [Robiginitomaculum sp.]|nr:MAG: hypothetical protein COA91_06630 [Robiginitomaculum sp.]
MENNIRKIEGNWDLGFSLDKHTIRSVLTGYNEYGRMTFDTTRTEIGEAIYQLKYQQDWEQVQPLAAEFVSTVLPKFRNIGLLIPAPPSTRRSR